MKLVVKEDGTRVLVVLEEITDTRPEGVRVLIIFHGEVHDVVGDRALDPVLDSVISLGPERIGRCGCSVVNVLEKTELAAHGLEEGGPLGVVGLLHLENDGDVRADNDGGVGIEDDWSGVVCEGCRA